QAQLGGMWSDAWTSFFVFPTLRVLVYCASVAGIALVGALLAPYARRDALVRYSISGALLGILPASAVFSADRLLTWVALGACVAVATFLAPQLRQSTTDVEQPRWLARLLPAVAFLMVLSNLVLAPLLLPSRARGNAALRDVLARADAALPTDESVRDKTAIFINPPAVPLASYIPITRAALGVPRPRTQRILGTATTELTVTRVDEYTLRLLPRAEFLVNPASRLLWNEQRPFIVGEQIALGDTVVRITQVTPEHLPLEIEVTFPKPLEDPSYLWRQWLGSSYAPFAPPRVGEHVVLPAADYMQVVFGKKLPIEARY
ncbi:MAG TPA: hypothetical protein VF331_14400, partial [Polyangiales bacterium]